MSFDFHMPEFASQFKLPILICYSSLKQLQSEGYIEFTEELNNPSKVLFQTSRDDLYKFQIANPQLDGFIKLLLRSYSGIFTNYVSIDESFIAKKHLLLPNLCIII